MNKRISVLITRSLLPTVAVVACLLPLAGCSHSAASSGGGGATQTATEQAAAHNQRLDMLRKQVQSVQANPNFPPQMKQVTITELNREIAKLGGK